jgi:hypothetical protein
MALEYKTRGMVFVNLQDYLGLEEKNTRPKHLVNYIPVLSHPAGKYAFHITISPHDVREIFTGQNAESQRIMKTISELISAETIRTGKEIDVGALQWKHIVK